MSTPHQIDLDAYFRRIGYDGSREVGLGNLNPMIARHVASIPFEGLDALLGRGISVELADIEAKLIGAGRGGYCFEQNTLMLQVLRQLGYRVQPISARVTYRKPKYPQAARTHVFTRVSMDDGDWFVDVGIGAVSPTCALRMELDTVQPNPLDPRRIIARGDWDGFERRSPESLLIHQVLQGGEWIDACEFTLEEMPEIDRKLGNWYTSAHPDSTFKQAVMVARTTDHSRLTISDRQFTCRLIDGTTTSRTMTSDAEMLEVLEQEFGIVLTATTEEPDGIRLIERIRTEPQPSATPSR